VRWISLLLIGLPIAIACRFLGAPDWIIFLASAAALLPLAAWIGLGTEHAARRLGSSLGGLLNATFGNAAELIITLFALQGGLTDLVKASITGSIIGNTLLVLGMSAFFGGVKNGTQRFEAKAAARHAAMMILAVSAMALPAVFATVEKSSFKREEVSVGVAILLLATYGAYIYYSYFSREARRESAQAAPVSHPEHTTWSLGRSLGVLAAAVVGTGVASELLVHAVEPVSKSLGLTQFFVGLIVIPLVGNVAENYGAITFARRNQMDLSISIVANSSTQIAVFVAPFLVLASLLFSPMDLIFQPMELVTLFASSAIFAYVSLDGETNWLEGVQLLALYLIAAVSFFFLPNPV
jgi:Ca2+:H+ antiporter